MTESESCYPAIEDYAVIGNCHTAALISSAGSIDWWCPMRFDRPAVFAALLDAGRGGRFQICPARSYRSERRYIDRTNVLETIFTTEQGQMVLTDLMPLGIEHSGQSPHFILRSIKCTAGQVDVKLRYHPRFSYGKTAARLQKTPYGLRCTRRADSLLLRSELPLEVTGDRSKAWSEMTLRSGERCFTGLTFARGEPLIIPPLGEEAASLVHQTIRWWKRWADQCSYEGPYREAVMRSALALKLMTYAPSGAIVAAPTTSLPEEIGGQRNWDYRYCWLRDASLTMRALLGLGYQAEARAFLGWLFHATHRSWPRLHVLHDVFGRTRLSKRELDYLAGYRGSRPVRIGNEASGQFQLDLYGEVIGAAHEYIMRGGQVARWRVRSLRKLGEVVCDRWREPDNGIWEVRSERRHHTHSKLMCWRALDSLITMHQHGHLRVPLERFKRERRGIREAIEAEGYDEEVDSYVQTFENQQADASLLLLPAQGYIGAADSRMRSTYAFLERELARDGLWYRYLPGTQDGVEGAEGAFGVCSFWGAEYLARSGQKEAAAEAFEHVLAQANDVGLFAEEIDPSTGSALGNFPQAFTHIGLINAALALAPEEESSGSPQQLHQGRVQ